LWHCTPFARWTHCARFSLHIACKDGNFDEETRMNCQELAASIEQLQPDTDACDVARLCLLLSNAVESIDALADPHSLAQNWKKVSLQLQSATDQHAAMTMELEELASSDPKQFSPDQIWVLIRAIKVQSQILHLYIGQPALDV
jgi:hypothetical protein